MKCVVPGPNVKVLGRAIHSLAKLGDELYLETTNEDLSFRTVNSSKTAFASFSFNESFFTFFSGGFGTNPNNANFVKCQISMKSSLAIFKSPITLDKTVDSLQIQLQPNSDKLVFLVKYKKGNFKTHHVPIIECETLQAYYHKDDSPNKLTIQPKIVHDILSNFHATQDEITWKVLKNKVVIRNYTDTEDPVSGVRTETSLQKEEFDEFKIQQETEITFCLKELRAVLLFSDSVCTPLTANFHVSSKPIVFVVKNEVFEANIVVSTMTGKDYESQTQPTQNRQSQSVPKNQNESVNRRIINHERIEPPNISKGHVSNNQAVNNHDRIESPNISRRHVTNNQASVSNPNRAESPNISRRNITNNQASVSNHDRVESPNISRRNVVNNQASASTQSEYVNPNKEVLKKVFQNAFEKEKFNVKNVPGYNDILEPDSDESEKEY